MKRNNSLFRKLKGFQKAGRDRFLWLTFGELKLEEFVLYELFIAITDWDKRHIETYGTFKATNQEIAQILDWKADSTVSRYKKNLLNKGFLKVEGERFNWIFLSSNSRKEKSCSIKKSEDN